MVCTHVLSHPDSIFILLPMPSYAFSMFHFLHLFRNISCRHCLSILSFPSFFPTSISISISAFPPSSGLSLCLILERRNLTLFNSLNLRFSPSPSLSHTLFLSLSLSDSHSLFLSLSPLPLPLNLPLFLYPVDSLYPEYKIWEQYTIDSFGAAQRLDALRTSHPIIVPIKHAEEVEQVNYTTN